MRTTDSPGPEQLYFQRLAEGVFEIQKCGGCETYIFYPRLICPHCGGVSLSWVRPSGRGMVYASSVVRRRISDGGDHNVALIDLEEGPRLMSRVEEIAPEAVTIGLKVRARIDHEPEGPVLVFVPTEEGAA